MSTKSELETRKADIKGRINALSEELLPIQKKVDNLRERIAFLESDYRDVLDALREISKP